MLLTALAAVPRLTFLNLAEFKLDEATHYGMAYELITGHWRWTGSLASTGLPKPPLFVYVLALPMSLTRDPRVVTGFLGLLSALSVGLFTLLLCRLLGRRAAAAGGLLLVANPQAVLYARKLFTADLIPPLTTGFLACGLGLLASRGRMAGRWAVAMALAFSLLLLTTFSPFLLGPAFLGALWLQRRELRWTDLTLAGIALLLPLAPYMVTVGPALAGRLSGTGLGAGERPELLPWIWELLMGGPWPMGGSGVAQGAAAVVLVLTAVGAVWLARRALQGRERGWQAWMFVWIGGALLLAWVAPIAVDRHYLVVLYPTLMVLPAAGVAALGLRRPWMGRLALAAVVLVVVWQSVAWRSMLVDVSRGVEGVGTPLGFWWEAAERARELAKAHSADEVLVVVAGDHEWDEQAHVLSALLSEVPHRVVDGRSTLVLPPNRALLLVAPNLGQSTPLGLVTLPDVGEPAPASPWGGEYRYLLWENDWDTFSQEIPAFHNLEVTWASGAKLLGYRVAGQAAPGETIDVSLMWVVAGQAPSEGVHWFHHLLSAAERKCAQADHAGWPPAQWRLGDRVIHRVLLVVDADADPGPYALLMGQYHYPSLQSIPTLDEAGKPAAQGVRLALDDTP